MLSEAVKINRVARYNLLLCSFLISEQFIFESDGLLRVERH